MLKEHQEFLDKLKDLCTEYKVSINSCGCCDGVSCDFMEDIVRNDYVYHKRIGYVNYLSTYPEFDYCVEK